MCNAFVLLNDLVLKDFITETLARNFVPWTVSGIIYIHWTFNFVYFMDNEFKIPTKYLFTLVILHYIEIHEFKCPRICLVSKNYEI